MAIQKISPTLYKHVAPGIETLWMDPDFGLRERGLYEFIRERPVGWEFSISGIAGCVREGKKSIRAGLKILETKKVLLRFRQREANGQFNCQQVYVTLSHPDYYEGVLKEFLDAGFMFICPSEPPSDIQNEKPQVTTDVPFGDFGADLGIVENFLPASKNDVENVDPDHETAQQNPRSKPACPKGYGGAEQGKHKKTPGQNQRAPLEHNNNIINLFSNISNPSIRHGSLPCLEDTAELKNEAAFVGRTDGDVIFEYEENLPANWQAEFEKLANQTINRNRLKEAKLPYAQLLLEGYIPDEILQAWCKKQDACKTAGIEERYYPQLYRWLCGNGNSDVYADLAEVREASKIKLPSLASIAVKYWADTAIAEMYTELTEHPDDRETNMRLRDRIFARANELEANLCPA